MFEDLSPIQIEGYSRKEKNRYKLVEKLMEGKICPNNFCLLAMYPEYLVFDPCDFVEGRKFVHV